MAITDRKITTFATNIVDLSDTPNKDGITADQLKALFDGRTNEEIKTSINGIVDDLVAVADGVSGADQIGATLITDLTGATIQALLESIRNKLKDTADGTSGADFVNATAIEGLAGTTVQSLLEAIKTYLDSYNTNHKLSTSTDHDNRYYSEAELNLTDGVKGSNLIGTPAIVGVNGTTVKDQLASIKDLINQGILGQIVDGSITDAKLGGGIKVGALSSLTTTAKTNVVGAINELDALITDIPNQTYVTEKAKSADMTTALALKANATDVTASLALKADITYTDTQIASVVNGSPKGVYATAAALTSAIPAGNTNIYLVTADGKWYYWNGSAWTAGGVYQGTSLAAASTTLADTGNLFVATNVEAALAETATIVSTISTDELIRKSNIGKNIDILEYRQVNLFNKLKVDLVNYVNNLGVRSVSGTYGASEYIAVKPSTKYYSSTSNQYIAYYDASKVFISGAVVLQGFTTPANCAFMIVSPPRADFNTYIVWEGLYTPSSVGISSLEFLDGIYRYNLPKTKFNIGQLDDVFTMFNTGVNLFNKDYATQGYYVSDTTGKLVYTATWFTSDFISVDVAGVYKSSASANYAYYDANKAFVSGGGAASFTIPAGVAYIKTSGLVSAINTYMLIKGTVVPTYEAYKRIIKAANLPMSEIALTISSGLWKDKKLITVGDSLTSMATWQATVLSRCGFSEYSIGGVAGLCITRRVADDPEGVLPIVGVVENLNPATDLADFVTMWGGTNDFNVSIPLGVFEDEVVKVTPDEYKFYGALISIVRKFSTDYPSTRLILITPPARTGWKVANGQGLIVQDYADAIIKVADYYGIPVLDMCRKSGINELNITSYMYNQGTVEAPFYLHFSTAGGVRIGEMISAYIKAIG